MGILASLGNFCFGRRRDGALSATNFTSHAVSAAPRRGRVDVDRDVDQRGRDVAHQKTPIGFDFGYLKIAAAQAAHVSWIVGQIAQRNVAVAEARNGVGNQIVGHAFNLRVDQQAHEFAIELRIGDPRHQCETGDAENRDREQTRGQGPLDQIDEVAQRRLRRQDCSAGLTKR